MKYEWRRQEKQLYGAKTTPVLVTVPTQSCIMINGEGNPNDTDFSNRVSALYSVAYAVKMAYKKTAKGEYDDFAVYPLEGVWQQIENCELIKEKLRYTLVIRQPDFVTDELAERILAATSRKKPHPLYASASFGHWNDGLCVQMLHVGPYDDEPVSFNMMQAYCAEHGLRRASDSHREIYLSDARKTDPARLKTVLRFGVEPCA